MSSSNSKKPMRRSGPKPSLTTFWVMVPVDLHEELPAPEGDDDRRPDLGYFRNFGVTALTEEEACERVASEIADGQISWSEAEISVDVIGRLDPAIIEKAGDWTEEGVWYRSGRVFFPREESD
jgi:hypothetical protein